MGYFLFYFFGFMGFGILCSIVTGITKWGARGEISARGAHKVSMLTHRVANGTASGWDKLGLIVSTILGACMSLLLIVTSLAVAGFLYLILNVLCGLGKP